MTDRVFWGPAVDQVLAEENSSGTVTWSLGDNQNTVRDLAQYNSNTGTTSVVDHRVYTAFGQPLSTPAVDFNFGYTGRYYDAATGLQWNLNRWYNPRLQRWMGQDPLGLGPDANPYRYCRNDPTIYCDPTGLDAQEIRVCVTSAAPSNFGINVETFGKDQEINLWDLLPGWVTEDAKKEAKKIFDEWVEKLLKKGNFDGFGNTEQIGILARAMFPSGFVTTKALVKQIQVTADLTVTYTTCSKDGSDKQSHTMTLGGYVMGSAGLSGADTDGAYPGSVEFNKMLEAAFGGVMRTMKDLTNRAAQGVLAQLQKDDPGSNYVLGQCAPGK